MISVTFVAVSLLRFGDETVSATLVRAYVTSDAAINCTSPAAFRGAALSWVSAFPSEEVVLFPPLTYLKPTSKTTEGNRRRRRTTEDDENEVDGCKR